MTGRLAAIGAALLTAGLCWGNTFTVRKTADSGKGTLRWAITRANAHVGPDTIKFAPHLSGKAIRPAGPLPHMTGARTTINGDIDGDGRPDVVVNGSKLTSTNGLTISGANRCRIVGLAIVAFPGAGVVFDASDNCAIRSCHVGVNLAGTRPAPNTGFQIWFLDCDGADVGGLSSKARNVVLSGTQAVPYTGIRIEGGTGARIRGNYVGLTRDGTKALADGLSGIGLIDSSGVGGGHVVGGDTPGSRNVIAGVTYGVQLQGVRHCRVLGNTFGLAADGGKVILPLGGLGVSIRDSHHNTIGGTTAGSRNVFTGFGYGVSFAGARTRNNLVLGNYFGLNSAGTQQRYLQYGVVMAGGAGAQKIGGATPAAGNYFTPTTPGGAGTGIWFDAAGSGTVIRNNTFGVRPNGRDAKPLNAGIQVGAVAVSITDNLVARCWTGIGVSDSGGKARAFGNTLRNCSTAVMCGSGAILILGNLGNASTADDGGNIFRRSNTFHIENYTSRRLKAEGNSFGTKVAADIDAKITDRLDNPAYGRVDYDPLQGGVHPTRTGGLLALTGLVGTPTGAGGAEVAFALSAPAQVSVDVLNIAGRLVGTVARDLPASAGLNRMVWSGRTENGTRAPAGTYLIRVTARTISDTEARLSPHRQVTALCPIHLR